MPLEFDSLCVCMSLANVSHKQNTRIVYHDEIFEFSYYLIVFLSLFTITGET